MKSKKFDLMGPALVPVLYVVFLLLAGISFLLNLTPTKPSLFGLVFIIFATPFYFIGIRAASRVYGKKISVLNSKTFIPLSVIFYSFVIQGVFSIGLPISALFAGLIGLLTYYLLTKWISLNKTPDKLPYYFLFSGLAFILITIFDVGAIPLLEGSVRYALLDNIYWGFGYILYFIGYMLLLPKIKTGKNLLALISLSAFLFILMAFRTELLVILIVGIASAYYRKKLSIKGALAGLASVFVLIIILGYIFMPLLSPLEILLYRAGTTYVVFDEIAQESGFVGIEHGALSFKGDPRFYVGKMLLGLHRNITSSLLGPPVIDFGLAGAAAFMFLLGFLLKLSHKSMGSKIIAMRTFYPILLAYSLVWIEAGFDQLDMAFFVAFFTVYLMLNSKKS